ncbi:ATP-dependent endonuclease [uncultured Hyphomicrobium sp.]|jgi:putative ATP-dependent endonuclease of OLD family|uniref:AAA family ATPase n=1 Tax=uncultured Hyphomicrobium sp. TaxID=194373 RepID=UPI0025CE0D87|nr:ATP-dependent endonuclease [uncultured Hyphomicrobium sp.]
MKISKITIKNFKGLKEAEFSPSSFTCLVGENNAGKSTVLQAIDLALDRPTQLDPDRYYDPDLPIEFKLELGEVGEPDLARLAAEHREKITSLVLNGGLALITRYRRGEKAELLIERTVPIDDRYREEHIKEVFKGKQGNAVRQALIENYPEFAEDAPAALNIGGAKQYLAEKLAQLPADQFQLAEGPLPTGASASISALLPEPIYIPAVKNLSDDLKTTQSTSFGRLLGLLLEDMAPELAQIKASLQELNKFFNRSEADGQPVDTRHQSVRTLETSVEDYLKENFPSARVELTVPPPELKAILNSAQIFIDDGSRDLVENKGDGIKRSLTFALLQCYVARYDQNVAAEENGPAPRPLIFLFEEPELYLHPKSQRILFSTLARIADRHQVVVTTHSPLFFAPGITASFVRVAKKAAAPKPVGVLFPVNFALDAVSAEVFRIARFENADAGFFSRRVVLFEGESDDAFFKHLALKLNPEWDFESKNVAMVRVSGKSNFSRFRRFFEAFGIEVRIVADLDALFDGFDHLGVPGAQDSRAAAIQICDARIAALDLAAEPASYQIVDRVKSASWRQRYDTAKATLREVQQTGQVTPEALGTIDRLFVWENDVARARVCREDQQARDAILPTLDLLRTAGVNVLSRGPIESYYPDGTPQNGPKPDRALAALGRVTTNEIALSLSGPLAQGRQPELVEICTNLFADL